MRPDLPEKPRTNGPSGWHVTLAFHLGASMKSCFATARSRRISHCIQRELRGDFIARFIALRSIDRTIGPAASSAVVKVVDVDSTVAVHSIADVDNIYWNFRSV